MDKLKIFQELYNSEIDFTISTFWDTGFKVSLGSKTNGFFGEKFCDSMEDVANFLMMQAITHFPRSDFTKKYKERRKRINKCLMK